MDHFRVLALLEHGDSSATGNVNHDRIITEVCVYIILYNIYAHLHFIFYFMHACMHSIRFHKSREFAIRSH